MLPTISRFEQENSGADCGSNPAGATRRRELEGGGGLMVMGRTLVLSLVVLALASCASQEPYRDGKAATEVFVANQQLCPELNTASQHRIPVAYLEIDDQ